MVQRDFRDVLVFRTREEKKMKDKRNFNLPHRFGNFVAAYIYSSSRKGKLVTSNMACLEKCSRWSNIETVATGLDEICFWKNISFQ